MKAYCALLKKGGQTEWFTGYILLDEASSWMWIKDSNKDTIRKGKVGAEIVQSILAKKPLICAGYSIKDLIKEDYLLPDNQTIPHIPQPDNSTIEVKQSILPSHDQEYVHVIENFKRNITIDKSLQSFLKPHQLEGATFLLNRLMNYTPVSQDILQFTNNFHVTSSGNIDSRTHSNGSSSSSSSTSLNDNELMTGAILADDMGTGKTLTTLSVLWSICRQKPCKGIVLCPASLVGNWKNEVTKWFIPAHASSFLYAYGSMKMKSGENTDDIVHRFIHSNAYIHPILVICYESFRLFADALNTIPSLEVLVCDEGHRIKSSEGTKLVTTLNNCCAMRRLVITGTPIQNNLDELYAIVHFIIPGYLGSRHDYQRKFKSLLATSRSSSMIDDNSEESDILQAKNILKSMLAPIMIRRTQEDILKFTLPPRYEYKIICSLTTYQYIEYIQEKNKLFDLLQNRIIQNTTGSSLSSSSSSLLSSSSTCLDVDDDVILNQQIQSTHIRKKQKSKINHTKSNSNNDNHLTTLSDDKTILATDTTISSSNNSIDSSSKNKEGVISWTTILPYLSQFRHICNCTSILTLDKNDENKNWNIDRRHLKKDDINNTDKGSVVKNTKSSSFSSSSSSSSSSAAVENLLAHSIKLQVLKTILESIRKTAVKDKVVIASNYVNTLDMIQCLCQDKKWMFLRIDGSVDSTKRMKSVHYFNSSTSHFFVMLLSTRAGGVGLNLIGANHLVLFEPDWNPTIDRQVMARIYREGQTKPVTIYRLLCQDTIDMSIVSRQLIKDDLSDMILNHSDMLQNNEKDGDIDNTSYPMDTSTDTNITHLSSISSSSSSSSSKKRTTTSESVSNSHKLLKYKQLCELIGSPNYDHITGEHITNAQDNENEMSSISHPILESIKNKFQDKVLINIVT